MVSHAKCLQCSIYPVPCCIANVKLHEQFHSIEITNKTLSFNLTHQLISMFETLEGSIQIVSWKMHRFAGITCGLLCFLVASCTGKNIKNNNIAELFVYYVITILLVIIISYHNLPAVALFQESSVTMNVLELETQQSRNAPKRHLAASSWSFVSIVVGIIYIYIYIYINYLTIEWKINVFAISSKFQIINTGMSRLKDNVAKRKLMDWCMMRAVTQYMCPLSRNSVIVDNHFAIRHTELSLIARTVGYFNFLCWILCLCILWNSTSKTFIVWSKLFLPSTMFIMCAFMLCMMHSYPI